MGVVACCSTYKLIPKIFWCHIHTFSGIANSDPNWYQGWHSPYYNKTHVELRAYTRSWVDKHIAPFCHEWDEAKSIPRPVFVELAKVTVHPTLLDACFIPPVSSWELLITLTIFALQSGLMNMICAHLIKPGDTKYPLPCGLNNDTLDVFHELIVADEFSRCGSGGVTWALFGGAHECHTSK